MERPELPDLYFKALQVVPGYRDLFERESSLDELLARINRFPLVEWMSFLSRLHLIIAPPNESNPERHLALFKGVVGREIGSRIVRFCQKDDPRMRCPLFTEPQISTLQQLVFMYGSESGSARIQSPADFDALCEALFITWDLMHPTAIPENMVASLESLIQDIARRLLLDDPWTLAIRAFHMYQFHLSDPSESAKKLRAAFRSLTGSDAWQYLAGGLAVTMKEAVLTPQSIADGWSPTLPPNACPSAKEAACLEVFHRIRCGSPSQVRDAINKWDGGRPIHSFSLIGLRSYPIVDFPNVGRFVINLPAAIDAQFSGLRHTLLDGVNSKSIPELSRQELGGTYGDLIEEYIIERLNLAFGSRFLRLPPVEGQRRADGLLIYPNVVVILEFKGKFPRAADYANPKALLEREAELTKLGVSEAIEQIRTTICALWAGESRIAELAGRDWTATTIVPVIVTLQRLPLFWRVWPLYERLVSPVESLSKQGYLVRPRFMSVTDIEDIPDLTSIESFGGLLLQWAQDREYFECSFANFLHSRNIRVPTTESKSRLINVYKNLAREFGLEWTIKEP